MKKLEHPAPMTSRAKISMDGVWATANSSVPATASSAVSRTITLRMYAGEAPSAFKIPISRVRSTTAVYIDTSPLGEDDHNPPEEVASAMAHDRYYTWLVRASVPLLWLSFLAAPD